MKVLSLEERLDDGQPVVIGLGFRGSFKQGHARRIAAREIDHAVAQKLYLRFRINGDLSSANARFIVVELVGCRWLQCNVSGSKQAQFSAAQISIGPSAYCSGCFEAQGVKRTG